MWVRHEVLLEAVLSMGEKEVLVLRGVGKNLGGGGPVVRFEFERAAE